MSGCVVPTALLRTEWPLVAGQEQGYPFAELVASIAAEGIREPITIKLDWSVIDGAHRLAAARQLGIESVPVRIWTGTEWLPRTAVPVEPPATPGLRWPSPDDGEAVRRLAVAMAEQGFAVPSRNRDEQWDAPEEEARAILVALSGPPATPEPPR